MAILPTRPLLILTEMYFLVLSHEQSLRVPPKLWQKVYALWQLDASLDDLKSTQEPLAKAMHFLLLNNGENIEWDRYIANLLLDVGALDHALAFCSKILAKSEALEDIETTIEILFKAKQYGNIYQYVTNMFQTEKGELTARYRKVLSKLFEILVEKYNAPIVLLEYPFNKAEAWELQSYLENLQSENSSELLLLFHIQRKNYAEATKIYQAMVEEKKVSLQLSQNIEQAFD
eukprot:TRINITY_DN120212_c1_g1_i1.p2 TRINITY_DN120212_c1_g1~~TRINITY_DN120212_c1_g1_i1.p2  ORF type:complete len:232 (+),score=28.99 TRINITY_DN120212_c1_g1_i1:2139-2834(+)